MLTDWVDELPQRAMLLLTMFAFVGHNVVWRLFLVSSMRVMSFHPYVSANPRL